MAKADAEILLIEDDEPMARLCESFMKDEPWRISHARTGKEAFTLLEASTPDVVLLDIQLPDIGGLEILKRMQEQQLPVETVIVTSQASMNLAIQAMQLGARDFIVKPYARDRLVTTVRNMLERQNMARIIDTYRDEIDRKDYCGFIGSSMAMQAVYRIIDSAASSKATVFITGESGTGKEVCAEAIHSKSPRSRKPFIALNCSAIPKDLVESEIFGHVKGAFTGAVGDREGAARAADGGTLFLDEICEMELSLQPKLLRFLQTGKYQRVGEDRLHPVDVRIICATNKDPLAEVNAGRFREDLYYRLHVLPVHLPPLRGRGNDVIEIAQALLRQFSKEEGKGFVRFAPDTELALQNYDWPGNVRQLQNVIRNIVVLNNGDVVTPSMLPAPLDATVPLRTISEIPTAAPTPSVDMPAVVPLPTLAMPVGETEPCLFRVPTRPEDIRPMDDLEKIAIESAIDACDGNVPQAAHFLGISSATIYRKKASWRDQNSSD